MSEDLTRAVAAILAESPGLKARDIAAILRSCGYPEARRSTVNRVLYRDRGRFRTDGELKPRWYLLAHQTWTAPTPEQSGSAWVAPGTPAVKFDLYPWQKRALQAWREAGSQGIVEAVTGSGKTRVGLAAISQELGAGGRALVLVPTEELRRQWLEQIEKHLPGSRVGWVGGGGHDDFSSARVIVAIVNSARTADLDLPPGLPPSAGLLVGDECHRYGAPQNRLALKDHFPRRLGLSATYEREDNAHLDWLLPYFGDVCFRLDYASALREQVIAPFRVALLGVPLNPGERAQHDEAAEREGKARRTLVQRYGVEPEPFGRFMQEVQQLARGRSPAHRPARTFLKAFQDRRAVLGSASGKLDAVRALGKVIGSAHGTLLFVRSIELAERVAVILQQVEVSAEGMHSKLDRDQRQRVLDAFKAGSVRALVAPKVLDEGVDVPDADLGIILSASRTRRQMIQRMGRVVRLKPDGRMARFVIVYALGTAEDPAGGAHEAFLEEILPVAAETCSLVDTADVAAFVNGGRWRADVKASVTPEGEALRRRAEALAVGGTWNREAVAVNVRLLEIIPGEVDAMTRLGRLCEENGAPDDAKEWYRRALSAEGANPIALRRLRWLDSQGG